MNIVFLCAVFPPEPEPAGVMASQLATQLASDGHNVTMIVPYPNRPKGTLYPGYRRRLRHVECAPEGYRIIRCPSWLLGKRRRPIDRLLENATFGISAACALWRVKRPDIIIVETWPLVAAQLGILMACLMHVPAIYYVQDVYPEALEHLGLTKRCGALACALRAWDRRICLSSGRVIVIAEGMKRLLCESRGLPARNVSVIPNWVDASLFPSIPRENGWREENGIPSQKFVVLFAGTLGHVSGAGVLVDVARDLQQYEDILLLCVGEGVLKEGLVRASRQQLLNNIEFRPFQPAERICQMHASCDATLLTLQPDYPDASVPSKLITYLAAGRPVICAASQGSSAANTVSAANAGLVVSPGNPSTIANAILTLRNYPTPTAEMGRNARAYFLGHYTLERAYKQFSELVLDVATAR